VNPRPKPTHSFWPLAATTLAAHPFAAAGERTPAAHSRGGRSAKGLVCIPASIHRSNSLLSIRAFCSAIFRVGKINPCPIWSLTIRHCVWEWRSTLQCFRLAMSQG
jgi:hypothetical protein